MKNYDESVEINLNQNRCYIPNHPYRILITGHSRLDRTNVLLNLTKNQILTNDQILTKFTYTSKIHSNQSIDYLLTEEKK